MRLLRRAGCHQYTLCHRARNPARKSYHRSALERLVRIGRRYYHQWVSRPFNSFPAGLGGVALLILRVCLAVSLVGVTQSPIRTSGESWLVVVACVVAVALCVGVLTPLCCLLSVALQIHAAWTVNGAPPIPFIVGIAQTAAFAFLGAGAYSVDARLYGRRVVNIPK